MPKNKNALGRTLIKQRMKDIKEKVSKNHVADLLENPGDKLKSKIDMNSLSEFLMDAELSAKNYESLRGVKIQEEHKIIDLNELANKNGKPSVDESMIKLRVPRRPKWNTQITADQLHQMENDNFLEWRRDLAKLEEQLLIDKAVTPFEKNIEVWRQLWRVIEKSDIVVQIVDGRNPLFYRCADLEVYVKEVDSHKENILLINKADLLNEDLRAIWSDYLNKKGINHIFFSAKHEQIKIDTDKVQEDEEKIKTEELKENTPIIFTRHVLLAILKKMVNKIREIKHQNEKETENTETSSKKPHPHADVITIGMVGYPNVGKSSVINVLCKKKLVGVGSMPGKTKHFQTIFIEKELMLCDCPGLVFPNFTSTRAEMVCNGVLPIDTVKDWLSPIQYLCRKIPKQVFEYVYKFHIEFPNPTASQVLQAYAKHRGFVTGRSLPDEAKVSKMFLKDLTQGKLLHSEVPPEYDKEKYPSILTHNEVPKDFDANKKPEETKKEELAEKAENEALGDEDLIEKNKEIDMDFFEMDKDKDPFEGLDDEDIILLLLDGKTVGGYKLNKQQRRDLKFMLKRGEKVDIRKLLTGKKTTGGHTKGKFGTDNFVKLDTRFSALKVEEEDDEN